MFLTIKPLQKCPLSKDCNTHALLKHTVTLMVIICDPLTLKFWCSSGAVPGGLQSVPASAAVCGRSARAELRHPADARRWADMVEGIMGKVCTAVGGVGLVVVMLIITE